MLFNNPVHNLIIISYQSCIFFQVEAEDQDHGYNGDLVFVISNGDQEAKV